MTIEFALNGSPRRVEVRPDEWFIETLRERCGVTSPKDGCSPPGQCGCCTVLVDGQAKVACAMRGQGRRRQHVVTLEGVDRRARADRRHAFAPTAGLQCGFCIPGIVVRAQGDHSTRSRAHARRDRQGARRAPLPLHRLREDRRRHRAARGGQARRARPGGLHRRARRAVAGARTKARAGARRSRVTSTTCRCPACCTARSCCRRIRARACCASTPRARALAGRARGRHRRRRAGRALAGADLPRLAGLRRRRRGDALRRRRPRRRRRRHAPHRARRGRAGRRRATRCSPPVLDPDEASLAPARRASIPQHDNLLSRSVHPARRRRRRARRERARGHRHLDDAAHRARVPRARECAGRAARRRQAAPATRRDRASSTTAGRSRASSASAEDACRVELVPNGGAFGGKEDLSIQAQTALLARADGRAGQADARPRGVDPPAPQAPSDHMTTPSAATPTAGSPRSRRGIVGDKGAYASVGSKVLERAAGHASGPYDVPNVDIEASPSTPTTRRAARCAASAPTSRLRDRGLRRHARREGRDRRLGDALAQRARARATVLLRADAREVGRPPQDARGGQARTTTRRARAGPRGGHRLRHQERRHRQRHARLGRRGSSSRGTARVTLDNGYTEMGQGLLTVLIQMASEVTGLPASTCSAPPSTPRDALDCGQTTGSRATLFGGRAVVATRRRS